MVPILELHFTHGFTSMYANIVSINFRLFLKISSWTSSLITSLPSDKRSLLKECLPSMKHDHRILLHFLPYILLHGLLEGDEILKEKSRVEIQTITSSFTDKKLLDPKVLNVSLLFVQLSCSSLISW